MSIEIETIKLDDLAETWAMSEEPELNRRASLTVDRIIECYPDEDDERPHGTEVLAL